MDSAIKTVDGVDIVWMGLTFDIVRVLVAWEFDVLELKKCWYGLLTTSPLGRNLP